MSDFKQELGQRLKESRTAAKISVKRIAEKTGYGEPAVYAWEEGRNEPSVEVLIDYVPVRMVLPEKQRRQAEVGEPVWQDWTAELADSCKEL